MRIGMICPYSFDVPGGVQSHVLQLAEVMRTRGHLVSVLAPVKGVFAAQQIKPQARILATDRGIRCLTLDYDTMRGMDSGEYRLF